MSAEDYERGMTCRDCGQYADGCLCTTKDPDLRHAVRRMLRALDEWNVANALAWSAICGDTETYCHLRDRANKRRLVLDGRRAQVESLLGEREGKASEVQAED